MTIFPSANDPPFRQIVKMFRLHVNYIIEAQDFYILKRARKAYSNQVFVLLLAS